MAIEVTHPFVSNKGDGSDATLVRPSNWNEIHKIELSANKIIGRVTAGFGDAEELPVTKFMTDLLNTADYAALAAALGLPTTGDARLTYKQVATPGWVIANDGSIGDVGSGATTREHADTWLLFNFFFHTMWEGFVPLQNSVGAATTRAAYGNISEQAWTAKCRIVLPKAVGRAIVVGGVVDVPGAGLTQRWTGQTGGAETHTLTLAEIPGHTHTGTPAGTNSDKDLAHTHTQGGTFTSGNPSANHTHSVPGGTSGTVSSWHTHSATYNGCDNVPRMTGGGDFQAGYYGSKTLTTGDPSLNHSHSTPASTTGTVSAWHTHDTTISGQTGGMSANGSHSHTFTGSLMTTSSQGGGGAHNNMQPWTGLTVMIKL